MWQIRIPKEGVSEAASGRALTKRAFGNAKADALPRGGEVGMP
jgi:hypothetical protein